jgi:hypothetical protein
MAFMAGPQANAPQTFCVPLSPAAPLAPGPTEGAFPPDPAAGGAPAAPLEPGLTEGALPPSTAPPQPAASMAIAAHVCRYEIMSAD